MNPLRMFARQPPPPARFPEGRVGFAVGDIHGRSDLLDQLLNKLEALAEPDCRSGGPPIVVFLGDYVDRGPDSRGVIDRLLAGRPFGFERRFLKGNHEQATLAFLDEPLANRAWLLQGGAETLVSYGVQPPPPMGAAEQDWIGVAQLLRARMPAPHFEFLSGLERYVALGDYAFVHAGVDAARPLDQQSDDDLFWIRERFLSSKRAFPYRIVHGHTPSDRPYADARRVGVDTGAYASGVLTAVRLEGAEHSFVSVGEPRR